MATHDGKLLTGEFMRVRVLWGALCVASLVVWCWRELQSLARPQGAILIVTLLSLSCAERFLVPRLRQRVGVTMLLTTAELVFIAWLAWFLPQVGR